MPRQNQQGDSSTCELFITFFLIYSMIDMWSSSCTTFFNMYACTSFTLMQCMCHNQLDQIHNQRCVKTMMAVFFTSFFLHTFFGGFAYFNNKAEECKNNYDNDVVYLIVFSIASFICFIWVCVFSCCIVPEVYRKYKRR